MGVGAQSVSSLQHRSLHYDTSFLKGKSFLSLVDYTPDELHAVVDLADALKARMGVDREVYQPLVCLLLRVCRCACVCVDVCVIFGCKVMMCTR